MKDYTLAQLIVLLDEYNKEGLGVWVRQKNDFTICLVGVADANTGQFVAAYLPCARNSKRYQIGFDSIRQLETEGSGPDKAPTIRVSRLADYSEKSGG